MGRAPSLCGVILAAGESSRMGRDKALLPWPPTATGAPGIPRETFLSAAIRSLKLINDMVIVVAGRNRDDLLPVVYANGAALVQNPQPERGQFSSLQVGLHEVLNRGRDAATITLVDVPPLAKSTLEALHGEFEVATARGLWAVVPEHNGKHGHPILISREMIEAFLRAPDTATARDIEHQNHAHIEYFPVPDRMVGANVNTPEDYATLTVPPAPQDR